MILAKTFNRVEFVSGLMTALVICVIASGVFVTRVYTENMRGATTGDLRRRMAIRRLSADRIQRLKRGQLRQRGSGLRKIGSELGELSDGGAQVFRRGTFDREAISHRRRIM